LPSAEVGGIVVVVVVVEYPGQADKSPSLFFFADPSDVEEWGLSPKCIWLFQPSCLAQLHLQLLFV
jgi:hypothetical protein